MKEHIIEVNKNLCIGCSLCVKDCPVNNIKIQDKKAPLVILVVTKDKISGSFAASNMSLMAESHGLGVLFSGFFTVVANNSAKIKRMLKLKRKQKIVATLVIGYSSVKYRRTAQKEEAKVKYL